MRIIHFETALLALLLCVTSCFKDPDFESAFPEVDNGGHSMPERVSTEATRRVMILVSAGFNSLPGVLPQDQALEDCILYKDATPYFFKGGKGAFPINRYCGLSMYLPSVGTYELDEFYRKNIAWNRETHLVE